MLPNAKDTLRLEIRRLYAASDLNSYVNSARRQVQNVQSFRDATHVLAYVPMNDEIPFVEQLRDAFLDKNWYFPNTETISFQKQGSNELWDSSCVSSSIVLVPSRAVDTKGRRLGRGGGWYDRFLSAYTTLPSLTVVPKFAHLDYVPTEDHDIAIDNAIVSHVEDF